MNNTTKPNYFIVNYTLLLLSSLCFSGNLFSHVSDISGFVYTTNDEPLDGAYIVADKGLYGTFSDSTGAFSISLPDGEHTITASYLAYEIYSRKIETDSTSAPIIIYLKPASEKLDEVQVEGSRQERITKVESISVQLIEEEFLKESMSANLMQSLKSIPGIHSMDAGTGISKPMIRGMSYYRVVVAQNGIKQEGQQWSNHHGIAVDQQSVNHIEIIKGPASLQYGSDAIGGVINMLPSHVPLTAGFSGEANLIGKHNTQWLGGSANFSLRKGDIYTLFSVTHNSYADFKVAATNEFLLPSPGSSSEASHRVELSSTISNTAGQENAVSGTVGIVKKWGNSYIECNYYGTRTGFFDWQGIQNDSLRAIHEKSTRDLNLPWQQADNFAINHFTNRYFKTNKLELALGFQNNISREYGYLDDRTGNRRSDLLRYKEEDNLDLLLNLYVWSANAFYTINEWEGHKVKIGLNTQLQRHRTDGYNHILPKYARHSEGVFITHRYTLSKKWLLNSGARFDFNSFQIQQSLNPDPAFGDSIFNPSIQKNYVGSAFSLGINYLPKSNTVYKVHIGKSYRTPSVYELAAYGLHRHEVRFEKGNESNKPEEALQLDLGWEKKWKNLQISVSPFVNYFFNYLYLTPTPVLRVQGQVYEYNQTKALLMGSEASIAYTFRKRLSFECGGEYVYAVNLDFMRALPFTPPLSVRTDIYYLLKDKWKLKKSKIGIGVIGVASQNYTVPNELSTPGYISINATARTTVAIKKHNVSFYLKASNILNNRYYNHISFYRRLRIPEQARDILLSVSVPF